MKNLKKLGAAVALTLALGISTFAGIIESPPCAPPEPGIIESPPCGGQAAPDPAAPGIMQTPPAANTASDYSVTELAITLLESALLY